MRGRLDAVCPGSRRRKPVRAIRYEQGVPPAGHDFGGDEAADRRGKGDAGVHHGDVKPRDAVDTPDHREAVLRNGSTAQRMMIEGKGCAGFQHALQRIDQLGCR